MPQHWPSKIGLNTAGFATLLPVLCLLFRLYQCCLIPIVAPEIHADAGWIQTRGSAEKVNNAH
jgi:hypothetical protein